MGRTVSGKELAEGIEIFAGRKQARLLKEMTKGAHVSQKAEVVDVRSILLAKTKEKSKILTLQERLEKEFAKYAGKKAPTARIFEECIGRTRRSDNELSA